MVNSQDNFAFSQAELKKTDPVRHFSALTAPASHRAPLMAFYAFLAEIERIPHLVSDPSMGEIRFQWWCDTLSAMDSETSTGCGGANIGPLASALREVQKQYELPSTSMCQIIEAHRFDLYNDPMQDMVGFETYAGEVASIPMMLACQILNDGEPPNQITDLCGHAGVAVSLATQLFSWPDKAKEHRIVLPLSSFERHGVSTADLYARTQSNDMKRAINDLITLASDHHEKAIRLYSDLAKKGQSKLAPAFLSLAAVPYMLRKRRLAPFAPLRLSLWRTYWNMWRLASR